MMLGLGDWSLSFASSSDAEASTESTDSHGGGHESSLDPLSFQKDMALWQGVIFVITFLLVGIFAFKPIATALDQREQAVADHIAGAEKANLDAKELLEQYRQKLADAQEEVRQILDAGKKEAETAALAIVEKAKQSAETERVRSAKEIEAATIGALQSLAEKSATLATDLAGKMLHAKIDPAAHRDLIDRAVQEFNRN